jgi:biopolymer transport protein ExbD
MGRRAFNLSPQRQIDEPIVNLTPLIDVVFVILIMFIVIAPLLELDRIELADANAIPGEGASSVQETSPITIHVHGNNTLAFNDQPIKIEQLPDLLKIAKKQYPNARPQLFHDKHGHFWVYQAVKNAAENAGFQQMDIVLKPG